MDLPHLNRPETATSHNILQQRMKKSASNIFSNILWPSFWITCRIGQTVRTSTNSSLGESQRLDTFVDSHRFLVGHKCSLSQDHLVRSNLKNVHCLRRQVNWNGSQKNTWTGFEYWDNLRISNFSLSIRFFGHQSHGFKSAISGCKPEVHCCHSGRAHFCRI